MAATRFFSWWGRISFTTLETGSLFCCAKPTTAEAKSVKARARFMAMPPEVSDSKISLRSQIRHRDAEDFQFSRLPIENRYRCALQLKAISLRDPTFVYEDRVCRGVM